MFRLPTVRVTKRGAGMLVFGAASAGGGVFLGIPEATMIGMLMAGTAVTTGVLTLVRSLRAPGLTIRRVVGAPSVQQVRFVGDDVPVDVVMQPRRRTSTGELVEVSLDDVALRRGARSVRLAVRPLRAGEEATAHYRVTLRERGTLRFLPGEWRRTDPLGLFWFSRQLDVGSEISVAPATVELSADTVARLHALRPHPKRAGHAVDPFSLREFRPHVPGEDLRRVHWATSARRNMLMVRQPETMPTEHTAPTEILVDARPSSHEKTLELALSIAATLVVALDDGFRVTLIASDEVRITSTLSETLLALSGVRREPVGRSQPRARKAPITDEAAMTDMTDMTDVIDVIDVAKLAKLAKPNDVGIVVTGPHATEWDDIPNVVILRAGLAPFDSSSWGPGAPTREALGAALRISLCEPPSVATLVSSGHMER